MSRVIIKKEVKNNEENRVIPVDLKHEPSGIYLIRVLQNNIQKTSRAVKL